MSDDIQKAGSTPEDTTTAIKNIRAEIQKLKVDYDEYTRSKVSLEDQAEKEIAEIEKKHEEKRLQLLLKNNDLRKKAEKEAILEIDDLRIRLADQQETIFKERAARLEKISINITDQFLTAQATHEKELTKILTAQKIYNDATLKNQDLFNQRRAAADQAQLSLYKSIDDQLIKFSVEAGTSAAKTLEQATRNEQALTKTREEAQAIFKSFPNLIGASGPLGGVKTFFTALTSYTDKFGVAHKALSLSKYKELQKAAGVKKKISKEKKAEAQKDGKWDAYLKAKADLNNAATEEERTALKKEADAALSATGLSEAEADLLAAQENQANTLKMGLARLTAGLSDIYKQLEGTIEEIAKQRTGIDTRLYGSKNNKKFMGSYYQRIAYDFSATMLSPLIDQKTLMTNLISTVEKGIARDAQQFAMLATIKDKIATTFNVYDPNVLRLIKIQDSNTNAVRLGMEATLNEMLNQMYESTEYLSDIASNVRGSLLEAEALMSDRQAVEFEYEVQKWLGSMYSVGVSNTAVTSIAQAVGQLAAGQIEGITSGGASNLLIMAANNGNMSLADILANGLDASQTNVLLNNAISYMQELVKEANGSRVVQQQLAKVFGMSASDLKAITNIISSEHYTNASQNAIFNYGQNNGDIYGGLLNKLFSMANSMYGRTSLGEMLENIQNNVKYSTAAGIASNPVMYITGKVAGILDSLASGIPIPAISVMGSGVDTKLTVSDIMRTAALVGGFTQSLVSMIGGIGKGGGGFTGTGLLNLVGIRNTSSVSRGASTSESGSGTVMNASFNDMTSGAEAEGKDSAEKTKVNAQEESTEVTNEVINESILSIAKILEDVVDGSKSLHVKVDDQPVGVRNNMAGWTWQ